MKTHYPEIQKKIQNEYDAEMRLLASIPPGIPVKSVSPKSIFLSPQTLDENMDTLHQLRKVWGKYQLSVYFKIDDYLTVTYDFVDADKHIYVDCTDLEHALKIVGKGKCKIEIENTIEERTYTKVVCAL